MRLLLVSNGYIMHLLKFIYLTSIFILGTYMFEVPILDPDDTFGTRPACSCHHETCSREKRH